MYNHHFGLAEAPFSIAPDPRYLFLSEQHREALAHLVYGIGDHGGFVVLTGEVGTGKTTVCRCLLQQVPEHIDIAVIVNPKLNSHELLQTICDELGVVVAEEEQPSAKQLLDALNMFLLSTHARGRNAILIVDEAQNLAPDVLEQLRLLTNLETNQRKLLQLILLGQPELNDLLAQPSLRQLAQRITARYHLRPLARDEIASYIEHRLAVAGGRTHLFSKAAIAQIYRYSKGIPRVINLLCDRALLGVYAQNGSEVDIGMVRRAAREVLPSRRFGGKVWQSRARNIVVATLVTATVMGIGYWLSQNPPSTSPVAPVAAADNWRSTLLQTAPSKTAALQQLYRLWGTDNSAVASIVDCSNKIGAFSCIELNALDAATLRAYNIPAVLAFRTETDNVRHFVVLKSLRDDRATLVFDGREWIVPWADVTRNWNGEAVLLANAPVEQAPLQPGAEAALVAWIDERLYRHFHRNERRWIREPLDYSDRLEEGASKHAWLASHYLALHEQAATTNYHAELLAQVKRFQQEQGLPQNGVVDLTTVFALMRADGAPQLSDAVQKRDS